MIGILGIGKMGFSLLEGLATNSTHTKPENIIVYDIDPEKRQKAEKLGALVAADEADLVKKADLVVLAVIPQTIAKVVEKIAPNFKPGQVVISIAAGVRTKFLAQFIPEGTFLIRAMPNLPALTHTGVTVLAAGEEVPETARRKAEEIWSAVGKVFWLDEELMDAVTALSGSGPAYTFLFIEALTDAGVRVGIPRDIAYQLALHTVIGSAVLLERTQKHPIVYKDMVTSPGGTAIAGVESLERHGFRVAIFEAVRAATERAGQLADKFSEEKT